MIKKTFSGAILITVLLLLPQCLAPVFYADPSSQNIVGSFQISNFLNLQVIGSLGVYFLTIFFVHYFISFLGYVYIYSGTKQHQSVHLRLFTLYLLSFVLLIISLNSFLNPRAIGSVSINTACVFSVLSAVFLFTIVIAVGLYIRIIYLSLFACLPFVVAISAGGFELHESDTSKLPNILVIGIDSLRYDVMEKYPEQAPYLTDFISKGVSFDKVYTPLARTHTSWISAMTGKYPSESGIFFNLIPMDAVEDEELISEYAISKGYDTLFAMNDRRFSNIDADYGFKRIVGPKVGIAEFLIGYLGTNPTSSVVKKTYLGRWLFPYQRSNRAISAIYSGDEFSSDLESALTRFRSRNRPVFSIVHFTETHYPYMKALPDTADFDVSPIFRNYLGAVEYVDSMVNRLLGYYKKNKFLDNAVVLLVSDHGESFPEDVMTFSGEEQHAEYKGFTHGTSALALEQSHVVFHVQRYLHGQPVVTSKHVENKLYSFKSLSEVLKNLMVDKQKKYFVNFNNWLPTPESSVAIETGFWVSGLTTGNADKKAIFLQSLSAYKINQAGRVELKKSRLNYLIKGKELSIYDGRLQLFFAREQSLSDFNRPLVFDRTNNTFEELNKSNRTHEELLQNFCSIYHYYDNRPDVVEYCNL